jgi:hypothetical protein
MLRSRIFPPPPVQCLPSCQHSPGRLKATLHGKQQSNRWTIPPQSALASVRLAASPTALKGPQTSRAREAATLPSAMYLRLVVTSLTPVLAAQITGMQHAKHDRTGRLADRVVRAGRVEHSTDRSSRPSLGFSCLCDGLTERWVSHIDGRVTSRNQETSHECLNPQRSHSIQQ